MKDTKILLDSISSDLRVYRIWYLAYKVYEVEVLEMYSFKYLTNARFFGYNVGTAYDWAHRQIDADIRQQKGATPCYRMKTTQR